MIKAKLGKYAIIMCFEYNGKTFGVSSKFASCTYGPFVFIRSRCWNDRGLIEHELVHSRQFWNPLKWFDGTLKWEIEAYKEQLKWYAEDKTHLFATFIATKYGLDISVEEAEKLLRN